MSDIKKFSKENSFVVKGIGVILLLIHHLYVDPIYYAPYQMSGLDMNVLIKFGTFCKICLALFVFISGFGITRKMTEFAGGQCNDKETYKQTISRFLKLYKNYLYMFLISLIITIIFYIFFGGLLNIKELYFSKGYRYGSIYMILDILCLSNLFGTPTLNLTWWYLPFAFLIIFITPMLQKFVKKYGITAYAVSILIPYLFSLPLNGSLYLIPTLMLSIYCAQNNTIEKIGGWKCHLRSINVTKILIYLFSVVMIYQIRQRVAIISVTDSLFALLVCLITYEMGKMCRFIGKGILFYLGKYSMMIFMVHTLVKKQWIPQIIFYPENYFIVLLWFLMVSFIVAWIYQKLIKHIDNFNKKIYNILKNNFNKISIGYKQNL